MRARWIALLATVVIVGAASAACRDDSDETSSDSGPTDAASCDFNPPDEEFPAVDQPGVTDTEINVGAIVAAENPINVPFDATVDGTEAYFCKINQEGGVYGRELKLVSVRDDRGNGSVSVEQARALIEEDNVFAVLPVATIGFPAGANEYLGESGVPTFGFNLTGWNDYPNLFGERGSFLCAECPILAPSYVAEQIEAERVAILAYSVGESSDCANGVQLAMEHYGFETPIFDTAVQFGFQPQDITNTINDIRDQEVDLVVTCMDVNGTATFAQAIDQAGLDDVAVFASQGYDQRALDSFGDVLDNFYFSPPFWPFELADENEEMTEFVEYMDARGAVVSELEFAGWSSAALFVEGLLGAGPEFTRQSVIDAINQMEDWDAHGTRDVIDWTISHTDVREEACGSYVKVENGEFVPVFGEPGKPFVCLPFGLTVDELAPTLDDPVYKP